MKVKELKNMMKELNITEVKDNSELWTRGGAYEQSSSVYAVYGEMAKAIIPVDARIISVELFEDGSTLVEVDVDNHVCFFFFNEAQLVGYSC